MTDTNVAPGGGEQPIVAPVTTPAPITNEGDDLRAAAQRLARARREKAQTPPSGAEPAAPAQESAPADAAPPQEVPGALTPEAEPAEPPPIEPPRSWTKDEKERFQSLPRETQEYLSAREQEREREFRRSQNEHAEKLKGVTAKEQQVEQARQQYETALPTILQYASAMYEGEFSDIRTMDDVQRLATDDPLRYTRWDAQQKRLAALQHEVASVHQRQSHDRALKLEEFKASESRSLLVALPELADPKKMSEAQSAAIAVLSDVGFKDEELHAAARGEKDISVHDHRFQRILHEATLYRQEQKQKQDALKKLKAEPKPPVQRPGAAPARQSSSDAQLQALKQKAFTSGNPRDMAAYVSAKRQVASRTATR